MHSRLDRWAAALLCAAVVLTAVPQAQAVSRDEVRRAADEVRRDPDLGGKRKEKTLRMRPSEKQRPPPKQDDSFAWLRGMVQWLSETGRLLVYLGGAILVAVLAVAIRRWARERAEMRSPVRPPAPSHVQGLDIRTASLPDRIGAAALALWSRGESRASLSLLYRGALSRLVHAHAVPIRSAATEGECVTLARRHVDATRAEFFARLVRVWQLAVYGARMPDDATVGALCAGFDAHWPLPRQGAPA